MLLVLLVLLVLLTPVFTAAPPIFGVRQDDQPPLQQTAWKGCCRSVPRCCPRFGGGLCPKSPTASAARPEEARFQDTTNVVEVNAVAI